MNTDWEQKLVEADDRVEVLTLVWKMMEEIQDDADWEHGYNPSGDAFSEMDLGDGYKWGRYTAAGMVKSEVLPALNRLKFAGPAEVSEG